MASTSIKSAIARIGSIKYTELEDLKSVSISQEEQEAVRVELEKEKDNWRPEELPKDFESRLELFEISSPIKCVRIPKREQRHTQIIIDEFKKKKKN
ncbi:Reverse transcriptase domain-containing protein [Caenorhabditis elegans]|uniref:Reverse transcriptase domain-containing protein n=1 Tax=Caenorhabditis elegans TaxID=6239 RepID=Q7KQ33_CAEEL|nr:Reverse transcriptase domain-containing protein [Caenorhabditis elegans]CCD62360.1 Reverse transcriptase domain-containing protein [Caenorhabditis elegans]|eukprot:NP_001022112.1 Uncharacterized protein CELE_F23F1.10 [Caenorhabditis elegans]